MFQPHQSTPYKETHHVATLLYLPIRTRSHPRGTGPALCGEPYLENREFLDKYVLTALRLQPSGVLKTGVIESVRHHLDGSQEIKRFGKSLKTLVN